MKFKFTLLVYIILYKNRVKVYDLETGKFIDRVSSKPFSNERVLFGDFAEIEAFVKSIVVDLIKDKNYFFPPSLVILMHQMELKEGGVTEIEKRAMIDSARHMNGKEVFLYFGDKELSVKEAQERIKNKISD